MNTEEKTKDKVELSIFRRTLKNRKAKMGMVIIYLGIFLFLFDTIYNLKLYNTEDILRLMLRILPYIIIIFGIGYFLFGYLEGSKPSIQPTEASKDSLQSSEQIVYELRKYIDRLLHQQDKNTHETRELLESLRHEIRQGSELHLDEKQRNEIFNSLKQSFADNINEDFFKQLNENISIDLTQEKRDRLELLHQDFNQIKSRLNNEIDKLSRKANVNLVIGSLTTIIALMALGFIVFQTDGAFKGYTDTLYHYIPRLSLIVFIEVFAYFFLRLYKLNLNDMKYFQNELTTVELKLSSITTAINFGKDIDISAITQELSKTERNFILKKGETTVDLEKSRIDRTDIKEILNSLTALVNKKK